MFLLDNTVVTSASDLKAASDCEFAFLRTLDATLGRIPRMRPGPDAMYERTSRLGDEHEHRVLESYRSRLGRGVVEIPRPERLSRAGLQAAVGHTDHAFAAGADVVFQATFFDEDTGPAGRIGFVGFADFIVRQPDGGYLVQDTKLARHARVSALLQLAAYAEQLRRIGVASAPIVQLLLGDGSISEHRLADITPVFRRRRARLHTIIADRLAAPDSAAVAWGDPRYPVCGVCEVCEAEIQSHRDVLSVAGLRVTQRALLAAAGIRTIDQLAASADPVAGISDTSLAGLRTQASLQTRAVAEAPPPVEVVNPAVLAALPQPDPGDIFFDFEGDPLYTEGAQQTEGDPVAAASGAAASGAVASGTVTSGTVRWGLDYLFGLVDSDEHFHPFWAHDFGQEKAALRAFLDDVAIRRRQHPGMHIYHYAAYERTHLLSLAARHGVGEDEVDALLRDDVLVDLYPLVRGAMRVGSRSYSIKKLEPLYMGADLRRGEVTNAADSITEYARAGELAAVGEAEAAQRMLESIADYNRYDCVSTLRLRQWLLDIAAEHGVRVGGGRQAGPAIDVEPSPWRDGLLAIAAGAAGDAVRSRDQVAAAFAAAAIDYHRREQKSFWWAHHARLVDPVEDWEDTRDVFIVEHARVQRDWFMEGRQKRERRRLLLHGRAAPGSSIRAAESARPFLLYDYPGPFQAPGAAPGARAALEVTVCAVAADGSILVEELLPEDVTPYAALPSALTPAKPPSAGRQKPAIDEWAQSILDAQPAWPRDAATDLLRRVAPRTRSGTLAVAATAQDHLAAVTASILDLDHSYLAVQGPPGTGKTYLGARVIAALVREHGWKIGVVGQSHRVVENLLAAVVSAGLDPRLVGKVPQHGSAAGDTEPAPFTPLRQNGQALFASDRAATGFVIGGTAWDFSHPARVARRSLDLLVIDEAGQFSLAFMIAASVAADNLLLLGDPQQLPQVSQGTHPEPIDQSVLGWVSADHDVLPPEFGYFLAESRRMHPAVTAPVSRLSYEGRLRSHPAAAARRLSGIDPGLHIVPVDHSGNATASTEEAAMVVDIARSVLTQRWSDPSAGRLDVPLCQADLIVVTPYNAQLWCVRSALDRAGLAGIRVGTVDKFQGQEAVVAIVSLAASSAAEVARGLSFLIMKNRLNVAISRAQWAAYLIFSPKLTDTLPRTPDEVAELSAFLTLVESTPSED